MKNQFSYTCAGLGEPVESFRMTDSTHAIKYYGGASVNTIKTLSELLLQSKTGNTALISSVPDSLQGREVIRDIRSYGINTDAIYINPKGKISVNFVTGNDTITYRDDSSVIGKNFKIEDVTCVSSNILYFDGIILALNPDLVYYIINEVKSNDTKIAFDVNFRPSLWSNDTLKLALDKLLPLVDIFFCSAETLKYTFSKVGSTGAKLSSICKEYDIEYVFSTNRQILSNTSQSMQISYFNNTKKYFAESPVIIQPQIVDRIGSGDNTNAGILFGLIQDNLAFNCNKALKYGLSCWYEKCLNPGDTISDVSIDKINNTITKLFSPNSDHRENLNR